MLLLVANHELGDLLAAGTGAIELLAGALTDLRKVVPGLPRAQVRDIAPPRPWGLERVVDVGELLAQQRASAEAVDQPQIFERRDVAEVPDERAEDRRVDAFEIGVGDRSHQRERPVPGLVECRRELRQ